MIKLIVGNSSALMESSRRPAARTKTTKTASPRAPGRDLIGTTISGSGVLVHTLFEADLVEHRAFPAGVVLLRYSRA